MIYSIALGFISVLQAGLNRKIGDNLGISLATLMNNAVLLFVSLVISLCYRLFFHSSSNGTPSISSVPIWYFIPGILGYLLVFGIPYVISKLGASQTLTPLIASQLLAGVLWDIMMEGKQPSGVKIAGVAVSCIGTFLTSFDGSRNFQ